MTVDGIAAVAAPLGNHSGGRSLARDAVVVAVAMAVGNGVSYGFHVLMARRLGPSAYGSLGALLGLTLIIGVPAVALQISVARETSLLRDRGMDHAALWGGFCRFAALIGVAIALLAAAAAPVLVRFLHLDGTEAALWMAASIAPLPVMAGTIGMLQGEQRFVAMSAVMLVLPLVKLLGGVVFVEAGFGVSGAMAAATGGAVAGALAGVWATRPGIRGSVPPGLRRDVFRVLVAGLALFVLTNIDLVLARHYLGRRGSGLYAAGALVAKVAFFGPQFVTAVVFPRLTSRPERRRLLGPTLATVAGCCVVGVAVLGLAARPFLEGVFGSEYEGLGHALWLFGALGTTLALVQVVMYSAIAAGDGTLAAVMWAAAGVQIVLLVLFHASIVQMASLALGPVVVLLLVGLAIERFRDRAVSGTEPLPVLG